MRIQTDPFHETDLDEAAELLARRHESDRAKEPLLPERFTQPAVARVAVEKTWNDSNQSGVVARVRGKMIGYLIGVPKIGGVWGRSVWVELAGHAVDRTLGAEVYRDMYAVLSPSWVASGILSHYALIPASDGAAVEAWFSLCFGKEQVHGVRGTAPDAAFETTIDPALEIRRAEPADLDAILELDDIIPIHQSRSPVYAPRWPYNEDEARQESVESLSHVKEKLWLAFKHGRLVGYQLFTPAQSGHGTGEMLAPPECSYLAIAATRGEEQGRGVARALTAHGIAADYADGYTCCLVDWRATNLLASRFWPLQGFRPVVYRVSRRLDERILWAHGSLSPSPWLPPNSSSIPFKVWS
ncbi:MAG: GNAT family N-acetyltransferase [Ktedonobacterales bacterium]